jgi:hypothetical protein
MAAQANPPAASIETAQHAIAQAKMVSTSRVTATGHEQAAITQTAPQPLAPPEGFKPSIHSAETEIVIIPPAETPPSGHHHDHATPRPHQPAIAKKPPIKLGKNAKIGMAAAIAVLLIILGVGFMKINASKRESQIVEGILTHAESATDVTIEEKSLQLILRSVISDQSDSHVQRVCAALVIAKATDSTDVDAQVVDFVMKHPELSVRTKEAVFGNVLRLRNNLVIMPAMLEIISSQNDPALLVAALQSVRQMMGDTHFGKLLSLLSSTTDNLVRDALEANISEILRKSPNLDLLAKQLAGARESNFKPDVQRSLQRLISLANTLQPAKNK